MGAAAGGGVCVRLLGDFDVLLPDGTRAGPWERPAARRLLQLLLLAPGHAVAREVLAETLFPHLPPPRASNALSKALTMARAALHEDQPGAQAVLDADRTTIRIRADIDVRLDLDERRLEVADALRLPAGPLQAGALEPLRHADYALLPEEPYADWTQAHRSEAERLRLDVLIGYARACAPADAAAAWADVAAAAPTNEEACAALVERHLAAGERDRAIRTYHRCRAALLDELGVEPSAELTALLAGELAPAPAAARPVEAVSGSEPVGRGELLRRLLQSCVHPHRPRAVEVIGPAGIGKTSLIRALARQLEEHGWSTRQVTAAPDDRLVPYGGLRSLLDELLVDADPADFPLLQAVTTAAAPSTERTLDAARGRLADELVTLLDRAAGSRPVAVLLDDAHWMDEAQRALVARVAAGPSRHWVLVVVARSDEPNATVPDLPLDTPRLTVPPLLPDAMAELVRTELSDAPPAAVDRIVQRSRGNAFFGLELARQWLLGGQSDEAETRVPERIVELLRRRIDGCDAAARSLVPLIALAGRDATYELVLRAAAQTTPTDSIELSIRALDELTAAHLLVETPTGLRLLHPLLRDAALATVNPIRRGALHRMLADALQSLDADPLAIARHRISAFASARLVELAPAAAEAGFDAGHRARSIFANDAAMELLRGGLDAYAVVPRADSERLRPGAVAAWVTIADLHLDEEDTAAAADAARIAISLAGTDDERADAWAKLAGVSYRLGDLARFGATLQEGLATLTPGESPAWARLTSDIGWWLHREGRRDEARTRLEQARRVLQGSDDDRILSRCLDRLALATSWLDPEAALVVADEALVTARRTQDESLEAVVLLHRGEILSMAGRTGDGLIDLDAAAGRFVVAGDRYMQSVVLWVRAVVLERHGDVPAALAARDAELVLLEAVGNQRHLAEAHRHRAKLLEALGRGEDRQRAHEAALEAARASGDATVAERVEADIRDALVSGRVREA